MPPRTVVVHNEEGEPARCRAALERAGFRSFEAGSHEEALANSRESGGEIDLLLTAVMELVVEAIELRGTLPVIITAQGSDEELVATVRALLYSSRST